MEADLFLPALAGALATAAAPAPDAPIRTADATAAPPAAGSAAPRPPPAPADSDSGVFEFLSVLDSDFRLGPWRLKGYVQIDAADYAQDAPGPPETDFRRAGIGSSDPLRARELDDGAALRRARLGGEGYIGKYVTYRTTLEFGANVRTGNAQIAEAWINYRKYAPYVFVVGAYPQPANMADATSSDASLFLERPTAANLSRNLGAGEGRIGMTLRRTTPRWFWAMSLTGPALNPPEKATPRSAIVGRVARTWATSQGRGLHIGASATYVLVPHGDRGKAGAFPARFDATPEVRVDNSKLIDTGDIPADHSYVLGAEFAAQRDNLYLQAEAFRFGVDRDNEGALDRSDPHFFGWYVEGSWILTGERRRYDTARSSFWFPKPNRPLGQGGWGALELAVRYSRMDLNYHEGLEGLPPPPDGVRGGDQKIIGVAALWYPRPRFRFMLSYTHVDVDRLNPASPDDPQPFGPPPTTPPVGVQIGQTMDIIALRGRYAF